MNKALENELYDMDDVFFRQKNYDMSRTCMCWGLECGDGWYNPIKSFVSKVSLLNSMLRQYNRCIVAHQIKSKWADFTCYWGMEVLDESKGDALNEKEEQRVNILHGMMNDIVQSCENECAHTCEICGKYSIWENEVFPCGSWITVKCIDCAQKSHRESGVIKSFDDGFSFISPYARTPVTIDGIQYCTVAAAFYGACFSNLRGILNRISDPREVLTVVNGMGITEYPENSMEVLKGVMRERYVQHNKEKELLMGIDGMDIRINFKNNFFGIREGDRNSYGDMIKNLIEEFKGEQQ